jgi:hypothetical protein
MTYGNREVIAKRFMILVSMLNQATLNTAFTLEDDSEEFTRINADFLGSMKIIHDEFDKSAYEKEGKNRAQVTLKQLIHSNKISGATFKAYSSLQSQAVRVLENLFPGRTFFVFVGHVEKEHPPATSGNEDFKIENLGKINVFVFSIPCEDIVPISQGTSDSYGEALQLYANQEINGIRNTPRALLHKDVLEHM